MRSGLGAIGIGFGLIPVDCVVLQSTIVSIFDLDDELNIGSALSVKILCWSEEW